MAHHPNVFRQINNAYQMLKTQLSNRVYEDEVDLIHTKLNAIQEMSKFIKALSYVKHKNTKERMVVYLQSGLNARSTAAHFGIDNVNVIEQTVKYTSDKLQPVVSVPLSQVMQAYDIEGVEAALQAFHLATRQEIPTEHFLQGIPELFPEPKYNPKFNITDCLSEIKFLGTFTHVYVSQLLQNGVGQEKLAHILSLLSTSNGSDSERQALLHFLSGEFSKSSDGNNNTMKDQLRAMLNWLEEQNVYAM